jgi:hypothetical protein
MREVEKPHYYVLNEQGEPQPESDIVAWGQCFHSKNRILKQETIGESWISTVFLGIDHNWGEGPPVLWETMVFGGALDQEQDRCSGSREQAEAMHARMVALVRQAEMPAAHPPGSATRANISGF